MHNWLAADMVRPSFSQNEPAAAAAVAAAAPGRDIFARVIADAAALAAVVVAPGRSIAVAGQTAAAVVVAAR